MSEIVIRDGREEDVSSLMQLIRELAEFERAPEMVHTDEQTTLEDWKEHKAFDFLVAVVDGEVIGISLYYPRYSTWQGRCYYLEDLYVKPEYRGKGIGLDLLKATAKKAKNAGAIRLDWQVIDWNEGAVKFYERLGAHIEKKWWNCKLKL